MPKKNIRKRALDWFNAKYQQGQDNIYTSKFYTPDESWSNSRVWFFQIPIEDIYSKNISKLHLLCENHLSGDDFYYICVPKIFLLKNIRQFDENKKLKSLMIYLSAEAADMFKEVRGKGKTDFRPFLMN